MGNQVFSCFIDRGFILAKAGGYVSMVTMQNWMFLSSFEEFRRQVVSTKLIATLVHIGYNSFPSMNSKVAQAVAFSILNRHVPNAKGKFVNLNSAPQSANKQGLFLSRDRSADYEVALEDIAEIPGSPIAYWASAQFRRAFRAGKRLADIAAALRGVETGDNEKFLRCWHEVNSRSLGIGLSALSSESKWFPYNKGGGYRKWFGNRWLVINWGNNGFDIKNQPYPKGSRLPWRAANEDHYFRTGITWGGLTSASVTFRLCDYGAVFDSNKGSMMFPSESEVPLILSFLNSRVVAEALDILNPSLSTQKEDIGNLPYIEPSLDTRKELASIAKSCIAISKDDESHGEQSWDFRANPLLATSLSQNEHLEGSYVKWSENSAKNVANMKCLEESLNRIYIEIYGLVDELNPDVPIQEVTLDINPAYRFGDNLSEAEQRERFRRDTMAELLSYTTGCMMGRYSLDHPGLILADSHNSQDEHIAAYEEKVGKPLGQVQFKPDADAIIPVLDGEWFEDDIVARTREFLDVTFSKSTVTENLRFIEESLGKDIRKYFCTEFYKDHLQTYKKRPIYWMVQSPKKGFACLIYLHRYTKDTLNQVLNNYFRPYLQKLEARLAQLGLDQLNDSLPTRERTAARKEAEKITKVLKECQAWEQDALLPLAQQRIELDLDDGVKVNYLKLQDVLAPIPGLAAKED
ncbi:MAG: BREX-1 system adenine-specific DNA-methyltransferase PglX [Proteobacteria bacterium]|nr:BREX-1 system adenine-specific DNA-methyltransferase PglX [Pseudomonadota bacterium]